MLQCAEYIPREHSSKCSLQAQRTAASLVFVGLARLVLVLLLAGMLYQFFATEID